MEIQRILYLFCLLVSVYSWTQVDREIFSLKDTVEKDLGKDTTFYDWLGISERASDAEISKAYRKLSVKLHPDKDPSALATQRFARLGLVNKILKDQDARERYDFFLKHGFPLWKGTDYYYSRYRPGLGTVLVFLYVLVAFAQYWFQYITISRHRDHMTATIDEAKHQAWAGGFPSTKRKVTLPNGKTFIVQPTGEVSLLDQSTEWPLVVDDLKYPTWKSTILFTVPMWLYSKKGVAQETEPKAEPKAKPTAVSKVGGVRRKKVVGR